MHSAIGQMESYFLSSAVTHLKVLDTAQVSKCPSLQVSNCPSAQLFESSSGLSADEQLAKASSGWSSTEVNGSHKAKMKPVKSHVSHCAHDSK